MNCSHKMVHVSYDDLLLFVVIITIIFWPYMLVFGIFYFFSCIWELPVYGLWGSISIVGGRILFWKLLNYSKCRLINFGSHYQLRAIFWRYAGRYKLRARHKNLFSCGAHQVTALMDLSNQPLEFNRNLYSHVEPYSSGFLKVSKIHTLYWEQSGNPHGHVSLSITFQLNFICFL